MVPLLLYALYPILWAGAGLHLVTRWGMGSSTPSMAQSYKVARRRGHPKGGEHSTGRCGLRGGYSLGPRVLQVRILGPVPHLWPTGRTY